MFDELPWKRKISLADSFSRRKTGVVLGSTPESEHHQREMRDPIGTSHPGSQSTLQRSTKPLDHTIALRVKTSSLDAGDSEDGANGGGELSPSI